MLGHVSDVEKEMLLPASPDEVWESLSDAEHLSEWFGADIDGRVEPGEVLTFTEPDGTERRAIVEFAEPGQRLVFRYLPYERTPDGRSRRRDSSRVAILVEPFDGQTIIRITETRVGSAGTPRPQIGFHARARA
jgi:uncharacterized protein YndB with AHSA1/START domain